MSVIDFKSVGKTRIQRQENSLVSTPIPIGIKTPLQPGTSEFFAMHYSLADQVDDNLRNLILTNWGERLQQYDFGANLRSLLSDFVSQDDFDSQATIRILGAVNKWMPYISLETFESTIDHNANSSANGLSVVKLNIVYNIPSLRVQEKTLEITLYMM